MKPHLDMMDKLFLMATDRLMANDSLEKKLLGRVLRDMMPGMTRELERYQDKALVLGKRDVKLEANIIYTYSKACAILLTHLMGCMHGASSASESICITAKGIHDMMHKIDNDPMLFLEISEPELDAIMKEFFPDGGPQESVEEIIKNIIKAGKDLP